MDYIWLAIFWVIYFSIHSVFALNQVKKRFFSMGLQPQSYRLIFNIFGVLLLIPIFIYSSLVQSEFLYSPSVFSKVLGLGMAIGGIVFAKIAFKSYDTKAFLGLGSIEPENEFRTDGLLRFVRHPLYTGAILLIVGYFLFNPKISTLISTFMLILYFVIGIQFEERKLIKAFGDRYRAYKKNTPMLIPRFRKRKSSHSSK